MLIYLVLAVLASTLMALGLLMMKSRAAALPDARGSANHSRRAGVAARSDVGGRHGRANRRMGHVRDRCVAGAGLDGRGDDAGRHRAVRDLLGSRPGRARATGRMGRHRRDRRRNDLALAVAVGRRRARRDERSRGNRTLDDAGDRRGGILHAAAPRARRNCAGDRFGNRVRPRRTLHQGDDRCVRGEQRGPRDAHGRQSMGLRDGGGEPDRHGHAPELVPSGARDHHDAALLGAVEPGADRGRDARLRRAAAQRSHRSRDARGCFRPDDCREHDAGRIAGREAGERIAVALKNANLAS